MTEKYFNHLLDRLNRNDYAALEEIYLEWYEKLCTAALCVPGNPSDARDVADEILLRLANGKVQAPVENPAAFLMTAARNEAKNMLRKNARCCGLQSAESAFTQTNDKLFLVDVMGLLTETEREILTEHVFWKFSLKEVAEARSIAYITVKRAYKVIKNKIKTYYSEKEEEKNSVK